MATISERLRELEGAMLAADLDMHLPPDSVSPSEAADVIDALVAVVVDLSDAARSACDARQHSSLVQALFDADAALSLARKGG